jgi:hypothetical protein
MESIDLIIKETDMETSFSENKIKKIKNEKEIEKIKFRERKLEKPFVTIKIEY